METRTLESFFSENVAVQKEDWDFKTANTQHHTHGMHTYPARMVPQIANRLIKTYSQEGDVVYDPMCGSGTVLVEATLLNRRAIGTDLNPLAILLSKVKTTPIEQNYLKSSVAVFLQKIILRFNRLETSKRYVPAKPDFQNIDFWFKPQVVHDLSIIREAINEIDDENIRDFLRVPFSLTVRKSSNTRPGEFKLYRYSPTLLEKHNPSVPRIFKSAVKIALNCLLEYDEATKLKSYCKICKADARYTDALIPSGSIDLIVTSPPYGDSHTTVAYGQFSRLSLQWLGLDYSGIDSHEEIIRLDKESLGGELRKNYDHSLKSKTLEAALKAIAKKDAKRAEEVAWFFVDLNDVYKQMHRVLRKGGVAGIVIGNRTVKETLIESSTITAELCEEMGFETLANNDRNIPYKTIPKVNSPTNEAGVRGSTMCKENIIIVRK
jgi:DNA modification methylase